MANVTLRYTKEICDRMVYDYQNGVGADQIALDLEVPVRSVIAKLSSLGVYQRRGYLNKRGEVPVRKSQYIDQLAQLLDCPADQLESLEKVNKTVLIMLIRKLDPKSP